MPKANKRTFSQGGQAKAQFLVKIELVGEAAPVSPSSLTREMVWNILSIISMIDILAVDFNSKENSFAESHFKVYLTIKDKKKVSTDEVLSWFSPLKSTCAGILDIILLPIKQSSERVLKSVTSLDAAALHRGCEPTMQFSGFYNTMQVFDQQHKARFFEIFCVPPR